MVDQVDQETRFESQVLPQISCDILDKPQLLGGLMSSSVRWKCWYLPTEASWEDEIKKCFETYKDLQTILTNLFCLPLVHLLPFKKPQSTFQTSFHIDESAL